MNLNRRLIFLPDARQYDSIEGHSTGNVSLRARGISTSRIKVKVFGKMRHMYSYTCSYRRKMDLIHLFSSLGNIYLVYNSLRILDFDAWDCLGIPNFRQICGEMSTPSSNKYARLNIPYNT